MHRSFCKGGLFFFFGKGFLSDVCFFRYLLDMWCTEMIPSMQVKSRTVTFGNYEIELYSIHCQAYGRQAFRKNLAWFLEPFPRAVFELYRFFAEKVVLPFTQFGMCRWSRCLCGTGAKGYPKGIFTTKSLGIYAIHQMGNPMKKYRRISPVVRHVAVEVHVCHFIVKANISKR